MNAQAVGVVLGVVFGSLSVGAWGLLTFLYAVDGSPYQEFAEFHVTESIAWLLFTCSVVSFLASLASGRRDLARP